MEPRSTQTPAAPSTVRENILVQADLLRILSHGDANTVNELIATISPEVRAIINTFERQNNRVPTADEIIWIIGEHHQLDPRQVETLLQQAAHKAGVLTREK